MRKIVAILFVTFLATNYTKAQHKEMLSAQISINQFELAFQHTILSEKLWAEVSVGLGNQDINHKIDDFTTGLMMGFNAFSNGKNQIAFTSGIGMYFPHNDYYSITVPIISAGIRYAHFFGKTRKHSFFVNTGYRYGKRDYQQEYSSDISTISTVGTFKSSPLYVSAGYGFTF